jgi:hypothetical protein
MKGCGALSPGPVCQMTIEFLVKQCQKSLESMCPKCLHNVYEHEAAPTSGEASTPPIAGPPRVPAATSDETSAVRSDESDEAVITSSKAKATVNTEVSSEIKEWANGSLFAKNKGVREEEAAQAAAAQLVAARHVADKLAATKLAVAQHAVAQQAAFEPAAAQHVAAKDLEAQHAAAKQAAAKVTEVAAAQLDKVTDLTVVADSDEYSCGSNVEEVAMSVDGESSDIELLINLSTTKKKRMAKNLSSKKKKGYVSFRPRTTSSDSSSFSGSGTPPAKKIDSKPSPASQQNPSIRTFAAPHPLPFPMVRESNKIKSNQSNQIKSNPT